MSHLSYCPNLEIKAHYWEGGSSRLLHPRTGCLLTPLVSIQNPGYSIQEKVALRVVRTASPRKTLSFPPLLLRLTRSRVQTILATPIFRLHCLSCTLRSGLHEIPTIIRTFPHGLENNHACKWTSDNFPGMLTYVLFLENCQKTIYIHCYSPIHVDRSLRVSILGDKSVPYF